MLCKCSTTELHSQPKALLLRQHYWNWKMTKETTVQRKEERKGRGRKRRKDREGKEEGKKRREWNIRSSFLGGGTWLVLRCL
jgi:hypothetical protein